MSTIHSTTADTSETPLFNTLRHRLDINAQEQSPLYRIPCEIRLLIWQYTLLRAPSVADSYLSYHFWYYPDHQFRSRPYTDILRTCRAIYFEAWGLAASTNSLQISPRNNFKLYDNSREVFRGYFDPLAMKAWQFAQITSVAFHLQQCSLESGMISAWSHVLAARARDENKVLFKHNPLANNEELLRDATRDDLYNTDISEYLEIMADAGADFGKNDLYCTQFDARIATKITHLSIRLGHSNMLTWLVSPSSGRELALDPYISFAGIPEEEIHVLMKQNDLRRQRGEQLPDRGGWANQIAEFPSLECLEIQLETFKRKEPQLDAICKCAKLWEFPVGRGRQVGQSSNLSTWQDTTHRLVWHEAGFTKQVWQKEGEYYLDPGSIFDSLQDLKTPHVFVTRTMCFVRRPSL